MAWLALLCLALGGQTGAQTVTFRNYTQADGLQGLTVNCLFEDREHTVWACTELGLHRYERETFQAIGPNEGLMATMVAAVAQDTRGRLWVSTATGLFMGDGRRFAPVLDGDQTISADVGQAITPWGDAVLVQSRDRVLEVQVAGDGRWQVTQLKASDGTPFPASTALLAHDDEVWSGCGTELCRRDAEGRLRRYGTTQGVPADRWIALMRDRQGTLWVRGERHVISRKPGSRRFYNHPAPAGSDFSIVNNGTNLVEDAKGRILTRIDNGVGRWDGSRWEIFSRTRGQAVTPAPSAMLVDHAHRLWIGSRGLGIQRLLGYGVLLHWSEADGLATGPTWSALRDARGELFIGSDMGGNRMDPATGAILPWVDEHGQPLRQLLRMASTPDGALWAGLSSGRLVRRDPADGVTRDVTVLSGQVRSMLTDAGGTLWIATREGLFAVAPGQHQPQPEAGVQAVNSTDLGRDRNGNVWLTTTSGIYRRLQGQWRKLEVDGAPGMIFTKVSIGPNGDAWLSRNGPGLWRGVLHGDNLLAVEPVSDPLIDNVMPYLLRHDSRGWLWIGSSQGLDLLRDGQWVRVTQSEGLLWDDISEAAILEDPDGSIWIGSSLGLTQIRDPGELFARHPLHLKISHASRGRQLLHADVRLPWSEDPINFAFSTPGTVGGEDRIHFRYRLRGLQSQWMTTSQGRLTYTLGAPGRYVLEVQALDVRERTASGIQTLAFEVLPQWWRSRLALLIYLLAGGGLLTLAWRWRMRRLLRIKNRLERLVTERTRELEHDKRELEKARAALAIKASRDELTGLFNRSGILEVLHGEMLASQAAGTPLAVALIDLDYFKRINDQHGHLAGDAVLAGVGRRLREDLRGRDSVGRYGGEELLVVMPGLAPKAQQRLQALHRLLSCAPYAIGDGMELAVTCSIGVAWLRPGDTGEQLLARADLALYRAKDAGRDRVELAIEPEPETA